MAESTSNRMFSQQLKKVYVVIMDILKFDGTASSFVMIKKQRSILRPGHRSFSLNDNSTEHYADHIFRSPVVIPLQDA
jgi:hypothetical protein